MIQFKENAQTDGRKERRKDGWTDPILYDHSGYRRGSKKDRSKKDRSPV